MKELFKQFARYLALGVEAVAAIVIAAGAMQALLGLMRPKRG
jgi:hypothetical protein